MTINVSIFHFGRRQISSVQRRCLDNHDDKMQVRTVDKSKNGQHQEKKIALGN